MHAYARSKTPKELRDTRATPWAVFNRIQDVLGIRFVHDVCAEPNTAKCSSYWTKDDDALTCDWYDMAYLLGWCDRAPVGALWMNPPYSDPAPWCKKATEAAAQGLIVVGLLPDDRSTTWYQTYIEGIAAFNFIPDRRISFLLNDKPQAGNPKGAIFPVWLPWRTGKTLDIRFTLEVAA